MSNKAWWERDTWWITVQVIEVDPQKNLVFVHGQNPPRIERFWLRGTLPLSAEGELWRLQGSWSEGEGTVLIGGHPVALEGVAGVAA